MNKSAEDFKTELAKQASDSDAANLQRFFKTGPGEYGEGDQFIGVRVPMTRKVCKQFKDMPLEEAAKLLESPIHEHRLAATIILAGQYKKRTPVEVKRQIFDIYMRALKNGFINNWDIVDTSCPHVVGEYAREFGEQILFDLAKSGELWQMRVSIISCFAWLRKSELGPTLELAEILWPEKHGLMQKAVGWMLREVGNCIDLQLLRDFLSHHAHEMPRTQLRYAIEKLPNEERRNYMNAKGRMN